MQKIVTKNEKSTVGNVSSVLEENRGKRRKSSYFLRKKLNG
jgi:hypothetical protein